jgi:hypothetical protein
VPNTNDERILQLRAQIEEKKAKLGRSKHFNPVTNCLIDFEGKQLNIRVLPKDQLIALMVKINALYMSAKALGVEDQYAISGYAPSEWIADIKAKLDMLNRQEEERALSVMEEKLSTLLSEDKRVELELDAMAAKLKE